MSRGKGKRAKKFGKSKLVDSPPGDLTEKDNHLSVSPVGTIGGKPVYSSVDVPAGRFTDVPRGMTAVPGCYVDNEGVLRFQLNNAPAVWHHPSGCKYHQPPCKRRITNPADIFYDDNNAPWCPDCVGWGLEDVEFKEADVSAKSAEEKLTLTRKGTLTLSEAVGDFVDVGGDSDFELGRPKPKLVTLDEQNILMAASEKEENAIYRGGLRTTQFYPSGHPRRW